MQMFRRECIETHCVGALWPEFLGRVELGESFAIETKGNLANGPIYVSGIKAGEPIAVHIEAIDINGPFTAPNGGPFVEGMGAPVPLEYRDGYFYFPRHFRLKANPSVGNVAVLPEPSDEILEMSREVSHAGKTWKNETGWRRGVNDPRGKHCHQDSAALTAGAAIHLKAQVDGAGLCLADVHGYISQGELAWDGIAAGASVQVRVERSKGWLVDWPLIETANEIMVCSSYTSSYALRPQLKYVDVVREAYRALRDVVAAKIGGTIEDANTIVATAADLRNCALYGLGEGYIPQQKDFPPYDIAVVAALSKHVFADEPAGRRARREG